MKVLPVGVRDVPCGWRDGRTDMTKLIVAYRNFANTLTDTLRITGFVHVVSCGGVYSYFLKDKMKIPTLNGSPVSLLHLTTIQKELVALCYR